MYERKITMFCKTCGKEYNEGSQFCIYCGTKIEPNEAAAESAVNSAESLAAAPVPEPVSALEAAAAKPAEAILPTPEPIQSSVSYGSVEPVIRPVERSNAGVSSYDFTVTQPPQPEKPEKYYTFGHLALCLAAVAVMAIVAGVFAGLYFSAIA